MPLKMKEGQVTSPGVYATLFLLGILFVYFLDYDLNAITYGPTTMALASGLQQAGAYQTSTVSTASTTTSLNTTTTVQPATTTVYVLNTSSSPEVMNISIREYNDELKGKYGYWALANYTRHIKAYMIASNTYYLVVSLNGTWSTFAGALSPGNGTAEPMGASGQFYVKYVAIQSNALNESAQLSGSTGPFNLNGTRADILKGTYRNQTGIGTDAFSWTARYFGFTGQPNIQANYTSKYSFGNQSYSVTVNQSGQSITGDIIT